MSKTLNLDCSQDDHYGLNDAVAKARDGAVLVKVARKALQSLLIDHGRLIRRYRLEMGGVL